MMASGINPTGAQLQPLWQGAAVARATGGDGPVDWAVAGISIDSRAVAPGDLFIALAGPNHDGHDYVEAAFKAGAAAALVRADYPAAGASGPCLRVADTMAALVALGRAARQRSRAKIIAVTGSVGKTGVKEALRLCLSRQAPTHASVKSFNNEIGVPLTLARMPEQAVYGVFELGMNHQGEIARLTDMVKPDVAIITTVASAHREFFDSEEGIADAKAEIFLGVPANGVAILNRDNRHYQRLLAAARRAGIERIVSFAIDGEADVRAIDMALHQDLSCVAADVGDTRLFFKIGMPGRHWVANALAVLAAVRAVGADLNQAMQALAEMTPLPGRGARLQVHAKGGAATVIDDSYNANPESVRAALALLAAATPTGSGRRIAALGDMMELGDEAPAMHAALAEPIIAAKTDLVIAIGPLMRHLEQALSAHGTRCLLAADAAEAQAMLAQRLRAGDVLLVKGSNASGVHRIVAVLEQAKPLRPGRQD
ncbi:MAG: UDP-N-acetylmuramoyl-tripeptide--D-alanyl-D-alanine ligase [Sphingomonadales bacterium]